MGSSVLLLSVVASGSASFDTLREEEAVLVSLVTAVSFVEILDADLEDRVDLGALFAVVTLLSST